MAIGVSENTGSQLSCSTYGVGPQHLKARHTPHFQSYSPGKAMEVKCLPGSTDTFLSDHFEDV